MDQQSHREIDPYNWVSTNIVLKDITVGGSRSGVFVYNGPLSDIDNIRLGCNSCTDILSKIEQDGKTYITFSYNDTHVANEGLIRQYPGGRIPISKGITILFNDGQPEFLENGTKNNPLKKRVALQYHLMVVAPEVPSNT